MVHECGIFKKKIKTMGELLKTKNINFKFIIL